jgi:hypothetical protein
MQCVFLFALNLSLSLYIAVLLDMRSKSAQSKTDESH